MAIIEVVELYRQILPIIYLAITVGLVLRFFLKKTKVKIKLAVFFIFSLEIIKFLGLALSQYLLWKDNPVSKFLLPPYQSIDYFTGYISYRFLFPFLISALIGIAFFWAFKFIDQKRERKFFEDNEGWYLLFGFLVVSHPFWIVYLALVLVLGVIAHIIKLIRDKRSVIFSLYHLWLPAILIVLLLNSWLIKFTPLTSLKF